MPTNYMQQVVKTPNRAVVEVSGTFFPNGSGTISNTSSKGANFTVARTSQGLYTLTFDRVYAELLTKDCSVQLASAAARSAQFGTYTAASKTLEIRAIDDSAAVQDIAANANNSISFRVSFRETTTQ
jgi:hypothetical protein